MRLKGLLALLIVGLIMLNVASIMAINELQQDVSTMKNNYNYNRLLNEMQATQRQLQNLAQEQTPKPWVEISASINAEQVQETDIPVAIRATVNDKQANSLIELLYRSSDTEEWLTAQLEDKEALVFESELWLDLSQDWEYRVVERSNETIRASEVYQLDLARKFGRGDVFLRELSVRDDKVYIYVTQRNPLVADWKVKQVAVEFLRNDQVLAKEQLTDPAKADPTPKDEYIFEDHNDLGVWHYQDKYLTDAEQVKLIVTYNDGLEKSEILRLDKDSRVKYEGAIITR